MEMIILAVVMLAFYFFAARTQRKRMQAQQEQMERMKRGDKVITIGGLHGRIDRIDIDTIDIDCEGIILTFEKRAIARVIAEDNVSSSEVSVEDLKPAETEDDTTNAE